MVARSLALGHGFGMIFRGADVGSVASSVDIGPGHPDWLDVLVVPRDGVVF